MTMPAAPATPAQPTTPAPADPAQPPQQAAQQQPAPAPASAPASQQPAGQTGAQQPGPALESALADERARVKDLQRQLAQLQQAQMSDAERQLAQARDEGRREAADKAALDLAAEIFRGAARDRLPDIEKALEIIDLRKLLRDGAPDRRKIGALVDQLAPPVQQQPPAWPGRVPAGPRAPVNGDDDWLRAQMR